MKKIWFDRFDRRYVILKLTRTHAIITPKPCQDRKVAAIRDACNRREIRVFLLSSRFRSIRHHQTAFLDRDNH